LVDHVRALGYKITLPKAVLFSFMLLLFFWVAPVNEFNPLQSQNFESLTIAFFLGVAGFVLLVEGLASMPETKRGTSKIGALVLILLGLIAFVFSFIAITNGYDILRDSTELRFMTTLLFGLVTILLFITLIPEVLHRQSFVSRLRNF